MPHHPATDTTTSLGAIPYVHTDPDGNQWHLTVHWADIHGQATPVGLDLRAFTDDAHTEPSGGMLNAAVLRSIRIGEVIEATRRNGTWAIPIKRPIPATTRVRSPGASERNRRQADKRTRTPGRTR